MEKHAFKNKLIGDKAFYKGVFAIALPILIQNAITTVLKNRTSFIVAHRLSTIRNSDQILVIGNKGIIESGTHEELLAKKGAYYNLYTNQ